MRSLVVLLAVAVTSLAAGATVVQASGEAGWPLPQVVSAQAYGELRLAADARGNAIMAWTEYAPNGGVNNAVDMARRPANGAFGGARRLTPAARDATAVGLAVAPGGAAAIAWRDGSRRGVARRLMIARGTARGGFGAPRRIPSTGALPNAGFSGASSHPADPAVAVADDGTVLVAWLAKGAEGCGWVVRATTIARSGRMGAARRVSPRCPNAKGLRVALDGAGDGALVWRGGAQCNYGAPCRYAVQAAAVEHGRPKRAVTVSRRPVVAVGAALAARDGRTVVAWRDAAVAQGDRTLGRVLTSTLRTSRWSAPRAVSTSDHILGVPAVAVGPRGQTLVAWMVSQHALIPVGTAQVALAAGRGAAFSPPQEMPEGAVTTTFSDRPLASIDAAGNALVAWAAIPSYVTRAHAPGGSWQPAGTIDGAQVGAALVPGSPGEAIAAFIKAKDPMGSIGSAPGWPAWSIRRAAG